MNYQNLLLDFEARLDCLENGKGDVLYKAETGKTIVEKCLLKLREEVSKKEFASQADEIHFFKHVKPQIYSKLIYYGKLFEIESKRPRGSHAHQIKYFNKQMQRYKSFFSYNIEFYNYYRRGAMSKDDMPFVRGYYDLSLPVESYQFVTDKEFSTCQDATVATIMAFDMLIVYLQQVVDELKNTMEPPKSETMDFHSKMFWTGAKTDLVELMYALQASGFVNSSTMDIKEMATHFERFFNVDLGNYYNTYMDIRARKANRTRGLERMVEALAMRMDTLEE